MKNPIRLLQMGFLSLLISFVSIVQAQSNDLPRLRVQGEKIVDPAGNPVFLHGVNLGNWLMFEPGALGGAFGKINDQHHFFQTLRDRFGDAERLRLIGLYRDNYITARDFDNAKRFGFDFLRIGFEYEVFEDDAKPMELRPDAFKYLDFAINEAKQRGMYVLFDLHGAQERQVSGKQGGRIGYSKFWTDPKAQERSLWLWAEIQKRYKGNTTVFGYEPLNEPFNGKREELRDYCLRWYKQLREIDPDAVAVFPTLNNDVVRSIYILPSEATNMLYDMHFYPGSFARPTTTQPVTIDTNTRFMQRTMPRWATRTRELKMPILIGEMNVVFKEAGGGEMVRRYYDFAKENHWAITFWTLKELTPKGGYTNRYWGATTNADPIPPVDIHTNSIAEIETAIKSIGTMKLMFDEDLVHWLTTDQKPSALKVLPTTRSTTQPTTDPTGEQSQQVN